MNYFKSGQPIITLLPFNTPTARRLYFLSNRHHMQHTGSQRGGRISDRPVVQNAYRYPESTAHALNTITKDST